MPGIFFAGNITVASRGLQKDGVAANSSSVNGFRYNARVLARYIAERLGIEQPRPKLGGGDVVPLLLDELARGPELWIQKGYLARVVACAEDGIRDEGILPLEEFVDGGRRAGRGRRRDRDERERNDLSGGLRARSGELEEHELDPTRCVPSTATRTAGTSSGSFGRFWRARNSLLLAPGRPEPRGARD